MSKLKDLTGQRFGRWLVVSYNEDISKQKGKPHWNCVCNCGNTRVIRGSSLKNGSSKSCGCLVKEVTSERSIKDLTGQRFGRLIVIKENGRSNQGGVKWLCKCECGNECNINSTDLISGGTKSCGCLAKEVHSNIMKEMLKEMWQDESYREQKSKDVKEQMTKLWEEDRNNDGQRTKEQKERNKQMWQDEDYKQKMAKQMKDNSKTMWQNEEYREAHSGENSRFYNPDLTDEERKLRKERRQGDSEFNRWSKQVKEQGDFICDCCSKKGCGDLRSHHLNGWDKFKEQRYDLDNGVCLCERCHKEFHKIYGYGNNTKEQYIEFKEIKLKGDYK